MSEANTIFQAFQVENSLKTQGTHLYAKLIGVIQTVLQLKPKKYHAVYQKHMAEPKSNFNLRKIQ